MQTDLNDALYSRGDTAIEWWFIHGFFGTGSEPSQAFMTSFFRHRIHGQPEGGMGNSLLTSLLDLETGKYSFSSRVNPELVDYFLHSREPDEKINMDQGYLEMLKDEIRARGPLRGIQQDDSPVILKPKPFQIGWGDFRLKLYKGGMGLNFPDPETKAPIDLKLKPASPMMIIDTDSHSRRKGMDVCCRSFPRLRLSGAMGNHEVRGEAWLDHQWGDHVLHRTVGKKRHAVGWDWFGFQMDDGSNWVVTVIRNPKSRRLIARFLSVQYPDGSERQSSRFRLRPGGRWESPRTRIQYPIQWHLEAPELKAELTFTPYHEDQEVPVFGGMRSVWEGAGHVRGTLSGGEIKGRARGEFQGYGYIFDFDRFSRNTITRVDRRVKAFFPRQFNTTSFRKYLGASTGRRDPEVLTDMIARPVWDLLERGGKRWRPIFTLCLLDSLGQNPLPYETLVCTLAELTHAGALIVDDIEDSSLVRRGKACTYINFGIGPSINAANTLYFLSNLPVFDHPRLAEAQKLEIQRLIMTYHVRAHFGQAQDLYWSDNMNPSNLNQWLKKPVISRILQMYEDKTSGPIMGLAEAAAVIAGCPPDIRRACLEFARGLGTAFQIIDDIQDFASTPGWKKKRGDDLAEGKLTYVLVRALERLESHGRARLTGLLCQRPPGPSEEEIMEGINLVRRSGALAVCAGEAGDIFKNSWQQLSRFLPPSEPKVMLLTLCRRLIEIDPGVDGS